MKQTSRLYTNFSQGVWALRNREQFQQVAEWTTWTQDHQITSPAPQLLGHTASIAFIFFHLAIRGKDSVVLHLTSIFLLFREGHLLSVYQFTNLHCLRGWNRLEIKWSLTKRDPTRVHYTVANISTFLTYLSVVTSTAFKIFMVSTATWRYLRWSIATIVFIFVLLSLRVFTPPRSRYVRYRNPWLQSGSRGLSYDPLIPNLRKKCSCGETVFKDIPDADNMVWTGKCSFLMHQNNYFEFQRIVVVPISSWCIQHGMNEKIFFLRASK